MKKRILIATGIFPPDIGGPATYTATLLKELPALGYVVTIVTYGEKQEGDPLSVIRVSRQWPKGIRHFIYMYRVWQNAKKADVVFAQGVGGEGLPAVWAAHLTKKPFIVKVVGDYAWEQAMQRYQLTDSIDAFQNKKYTGVINYWRRMERKVVQTAQLVITPSEYLREMVIGWGASGNKVRVIPNAVVSFPPLNRNAIRTELGITGILLVSIGRLVLWKGFTGLVSVVNSLRSEFPNLQLLIVGDGPHRRAIEQKIKQFHLETTVRCVGAVPKDTLWQYLCAADLFVLNTDYEGFSHQIVEAMAAGVPVVTTCSGGNPEIIKHKKNGWLFQYNDLDGPDGLKAALKKLIIDSNLREFLAQNGKETARQFSQERMLTLLRVALDHICES